MSQDSIQREIQIDASPERVWSLLTEAEHLGRWFGDAGAEIDLRTGGALAVHWDSNHTVSGVIEAVEPHTRFAWRWLQDAADDAPLTVERSTLVEFTLAPADGGTLLSVLETGFSALEGTATSGADLLISHTEGWPREIAELRDYASKVAA